MGLVYEFVCVPVALFESTVKNKTLKIKNNIYAH